MQIDYHALFQEAMMYFALGGLVLFAVIIVFQKWGHLIDKLYHDWLRLDGAGKVVSAVMLCGLTYYGATKGFWTPVQNGGGDTTLQVKGIYTASSNVVDAITGVTNTVDLVRVEWLGTGATADTMVSVRASETNEWEEIVKIDPVITVESLTNVLVFATETNYAHFAFWWFGGERPAIVVTEEGIEIRSFVVTTKTVSFSWVCGEQDAETFIIRKKEVGVQNAQWQTVAEVPAHFGVVNSWTGNLFTVDKTYDWQIITEIEEED